MARPQKKRRICRIPEFSHFPACSGRSDSSEIVMTFDEYETVRIIDLEELSQEECARRMNVARTTVQLIYNSARKKLAEALVSGIGFRIEGGNYEVCTGKDCCGICGKESCSGGICKKSVS